MQSMKVRGASSWRALIRNRVRYVVHSLAISFTGSSSFRGRRMGLLIFLVGLILLAASGLLTSAVPSAGVCTLGWSCLAGATHSAAGNNIKVWRMYSWPGRRSIPYDWCSVTKRRTRFCGRAGLKEDFSAQWRKYAIAAFLGGTETPPGNLLHSRAGFPQGKHRKCRKAADGCRSLARRRCGSQEMLEPQRTRRKKRVGRRWSTREFPFEQMLGSADMGSFASLVSTCKGRVR